LLGRGFLPDEDQPGKERVVVLSHSFWREDFGGDPDVIGKVVTLDGQSHTIVGVMPPHFQFPPDSTRSFWVPLVFEQDSNWPLGKPVEVVARLKKGTTLAQAQAAMTVIANRLRETDPKAAPIIVGRMLDRRLGSNRQLLWLLLGAAALVLLIACTNVASLLLARATVRQREIAMRVALGASRPRLLRQMLTESLLLSLVRTWIALQRVDLGFDPKNMLFSEIGLPSVTDNNPQRCRAYFDPLLERIRTLPGVQSAAFIDMFVMGASDGGGPLTIVGRPPADPERPPLAHHFYVGTGFFETMGARVLRGRTFTEEDMQPTAHNVVIDENLMRKCFAGVDPIGQRIERGGVEHTVVGVVSTLRDFHHLGPLVGILYYPHTRYYGFMSLLVRAEHDPMQLVGPIRAQMAALGQERPDASFMFLEKDLANMLAPQRFSVVLLGLFGGIALILATVGIYGLLQYSTTQQTHDIGIRMALGAGRTDVLAGVLRHGLQLTLLGVVLGVAGALALTRVLSALLYGISPTDPLTVVVVSFVLIGVALLASYFPARRAAKVDPMAALRYE
jgi:hypothetical protein